jgi:putative transposase
MLERSLHFPIKPGVVAAWSTRTVVIIGPLDGSTVQVRDLATSEQHVVSVEELQGIPAIGQIESDERRWGLVRDSTRVEWKLARRRERVLRKCISRDGNQPEGIEFACKALGLSRRTIYRLLADYRAAAQTTTLIQKHCGTPPASRRLAATREAIAMRCIEQRFLRRPRATVAFVTEEVERQCRAAGLKAVSRKAIDLRIAALDPRLVASRRHGGKAASTAFGPVGGHYNITAPLDVMQIDHTRVDAIVVSEVTRKPLGLMALT